MATRENLVEGLQRMLIETIDAAEDALEAVEKRRKLEIKALTLNMLIERIAEQKEFGARLTSLNGCLADIQHKVSALPEIQRGPIADELRELSNLVQTALDGGPSRPLLLDELDRWIELRAGHASEKKIRTDRNRIQDFAEFAGNRPVNKYRYADFQSFANLLARVPADYTKDPRLRDMTRQEAADFNDRLPLSLRHETLAGKAIDTNYFSPLRMFFRYAAAQYDFRSPLAEINVTIPAGAKKSIERSPFTVDELNRWFAATAKEKRADMKWLPLLATLTGARVGELIYLQGKDIYQLHDGLWVADLTTDLIIADGSSKVRPIKNRSSRRLFALHEVLQKTDFFDYWRSRGSEDWLFPAAFRHGKKLVKDPADAASKRLNRGLIKVGIHRPLESTFHSSRHTAKDIMRTAKVDARTADRQTGHAAKSVADSYGSKKLRQEEVAVLAALSLPADLDLTPYFKK